jgi:hypothetical protein
LWVAWVIYYYTRLKIRDSVVFTNPNTGERIVKEWNGTALVPGAPDAFGDFLYSLLVLVTFVWISIGAIRLVIRFFVRTVHEEQQKVKEGGK